MACSKTLAVILLAVLAAAVPLGCQGRALRQEAAARVITPGAPRGGTSRASMSREAAEASANSQPTGVHRLVAPQDRRSYATVSATGSLEPRNAMTAPRARSAQDLQRGGPNLGSGSPSKPALVLGGVAAAQTYEGAKAVASTDAMALNNGGGAVIAGSMRTTRTGGMRGAMPGRTASYSTTSSNGVSSKALSGRADGKIVLSQGNEAVAMAQSERN